MYSPLLTCTPVLLCIPLYSHVPPVLLRIPLYSHVPCTSMYLPVFSCPPCTLMYPPVLSCLPCTPMYSLACNLMSTLYSYVSSALLCIPLCLHVPLYFYVSPCILMSPLYSYVFPCTLMFPLYLYVSPCISRLYSYVMYPPVSVSCPPCFPMCSLGLSSPCIPYIFIPLEKGKALGTRLLRSVMIPQIPRPLKSLCTLILYPSVLLCLPYTSMTIPLSSHVSLYSHLCKCFVISQPVLQCIPLYSHNPPVLSSPLLSPI